MGSRTKGNYGGSGDPCTRIDWAKDKLKGNYVSEYNIPFRVIDEVKDYINNEQIYCLECGQYFKHLGHHLSRSHNMSSNDYKDKYNIPRSYSLCGLSLRARRSEISKNTWNSGVMDGYRDDLRDRMKVLGGAGSVSGGKVKRGEYINCKECGVEFYAIKSTGRKFCGKQCEGAFNVRTGELKKRSASGGKKRAESGARDSCGKFVVK